MKFNRNRAFALFLLYTILSLLPFTAMAEGDVTTEISLINFGDFELEGAMGYWTGGKRDAVAAYEGDWGIAVSNPYGDVGTNYFGHILEYGEDIVLEEGKLYTFSGYISNPFADDACEPVVSASLNADSQELYIDISNVGFDWNCVSASFIAKENTTCKLIISCEGGDEDLGFFADSLSLIEESKLPSYTLIEGPEDVFIPENGSKAYQYNIAAYNEDGVKLNIVMDSYNFEIDPLPEGVDFDSQNGILVVSSLAPQDFEMVISCSAVAGGELKPSSKTVTTTRNLLSDPYFEEGREMWTSEYPMDYTDGYISLFADQTGDYGKYTSITYTEQLLLFEDKMYVFHADVKSDDEFSSSSVYIPNLSFSSSGYAEINITGIGGDLSRATGAFIVEDTGFYDLTINLFAPTERPIYIDNVYLGVEQEAATTISIHAPGNICVPESEIVLPCYAGVLNQMGQVIESLTPTLSIFPEKKGVYLSDGKIIVEHGAERDNYVVTARYGDIEANLTITVSDDYIGDGGFEEKEANEWWTSSDGSRFTIVDYEGDLSGHVYCPDSECIVVNNSYMEITEGDYYVFSASPNFGNATVTAFIADAYTSEYIPFAIYENTEGAKVPFSLDRTVIGRLVLYLESDDFIGVFLDDISIVPAELSASAISVGYGGHGDFLNGSYEYVNNMAESADADISATRWYISPTYDGQYVPIGIPNQNYLEFTRDMIGQYVVFEVTPICSYTGLVSEPLRSLPFLIEPEDEGPFTGDTQLSSMSPAELNDTREHSFTDITGHWAERMIATLANSGIVTGKTNKSFVPDGYVTRAEFAAMIARSFSLSSIPYSGQFKDVSSTDWYSGWIEACYRRGIIQGMSENEFSPNERITREQMAAIIYRAYSISNGPMPHDLELRYYDSYQISQWSYEAVKNCTNLNILAGNEMNLFKPADPATRAEAAATIYRTLTCFN